MKSARFSARWHRELFLILGLASVGLTQADLERLHGLQEDYRKLNREGKYAEALPLAQSAVDLAEKVRGLQHPDTAAALNDLAELYHGQGQYAKAEPLYVRALAIREKVLGAQNPDTAETLNDLALLYDDQRQYAKAEPLYVRALAIREKALGEQNPDTARTVNNLAELYQEQGQYAKAEPLYRRALATFEKLGAQHRETAATLSNTTTTLNNLALLYEDQRQYAKAEPLYVRALAIRKKVLGEQHPDTAATLNSLAELYRKQGQYAKAEPLYGRALAIQEKVLGEQDPVTAATLHNLALLYDNQKQYAKAEPLYVRALAIQEKALGEQHPDTARMLYNLARLYENQAQYAKAEPLYGRALAIQEKVLGEQHPDTAATLNDFADLYRKQGQYAKAEPLFVRALAICEKVLGAQDPSTAATLNNLAVLYREQGQYVKAEPLYQRALAIREKVLGAQHPGTARTLTNLADLYQEQGQYAKAEPLLRRALAIDEKVLGEQHPDTAATLNNLGALYEKQGQHVKAEPLLQRAVAIDDKMLGARHETALALSNLAELYQEQGQYAKAEPLLRRALVIDEKVLGAENPQASKSRNNLTVLYFDKGEQDRGRQVLEEGWPSQLKYLERSLAFTDETWRHKALADFRKNLFLLQSLTRNSLAVRRIGLESILASKGRAFEDTITALLAIRPRLPLGQQKELDELIALRREEVGLVAPHTDAGEARQRELNVRDDQLSEELAQGSLPFRNLTRSPTIEQVTANLGTAALIELLSYKEFYEPKREGRQWGPERYVAYLLTGNGNVQRLDLGPASDVDVLVQRYRMAMGRLANSALAKDTAREIDKLTLEPIRKALPGVTEFYMAADGQLRLFPWAALRDDKNDLLIEKYRIHTLLTGRDLVRGAPLPSAQAPWVGGLDTFGQVDGKAKFPALPGALVEARAVADVMKPKAQMLPPEQMTKSFLLEKVNGPRILHLATHGFYREAHGGLALRDANLSDANVLTDSDVAKLKLFGTQLVVLSACSTGLGEVSFADGITGLQRSLTLAGARSEILTLWPVSDAKTKELMVSFYRNLFEKGMTKAEALRQAQLEMARQGVSEYYWAPFVLYGDGGVLGQ